MSILNGLFKKELRMSQNWFLSSYVLLIFIFTISYGIGLYYDLPVVLATVSFVFLFLHVFYIPLFLLFSLSTEGKTQLWLHNPNSGAKLLLAKTLAAISFFLISMTSNVLIAWFGIAKASNSDPFSEIQHYLVQNLLLFEGIVFFASLYSGIWLLFYWTLFSSMKSNPLLKKLRWLICIALWIILSTIGNFIRNNSYYKKFVEMGQVKFDELSNQDWTKHFPGLTDFSVFSIVISVSVALVVFYSAVWLLERKVEV